MKKYILVILAVVASVFTTYADELYAYTLKVNQKNGDQMTFKFQDEPVATIEGENLKISLLTVAGEDILVPISNLENLTFEKNALSGVENMKAAAGVAFALTKTALNAEGLEAGTVVSIYAIDGRIAAQGVCDATGNCSISLENVAPGVYAVKAGNNSFKFVR